MRQVLDVDGAVELEVRDVDVDVAGDVGGEALDLDLVEDLREHAALGLDAGRGAGQLNGHRNPHGDVHGDALEIDVQQLAFDGLVLPVDDHDLFGPGAFNVQVEDRVVAGLRVQDLGDDLGVDCDGDAGSTGTVDDGGNQPLDAHAASMIFVEGAGAGCGIDCLDRGGVGHGGFPFGHGVGPAPFAFAAVS